MARCGNTCLRKFLHTTARSLWLLNTSRPLLLYFVDQKKEERAREENDRVAVQKIHVQDSNGIAEIGSIGGRHLSPVQ